MNGPGEWDEPGAGRGVGKTIDVSFLRNMAGIPCAAVGIDGWGRRQDCVRNVGHTGRHLAADWNIRYPTAVWW